VPNKHLSLQDPHLTTSLTADKGQLSIKVSARSLARFVELAFEGADIVFSDNYFDLPANRSYLVTCPLPHGWTEKQAKAALRVMSLFDA
jgi:beta-mannosidase